MVTTTFAEGAERNKALGVWGAVSGSGGAAGVLLGGVLTEYLAWMCHEGRAPARGRGAVLSA